MSKETSLIVSMSEHAKTPTIYISDGKRKMGCTLRSEDIDWIVKELQASKEGFEAFDKVSNEIAEEE